ncbi:hypothetical protein AB5N19_12093 [Seiridium cardinale]|uniref:DUF4267 domain-containing protein n=1 Tax=Seiridium cardinale TaxID=138064 RepID=A0ABR2XQN7_9PEZI
MAPSSLLFNAGALFGTIPGFIGIKGLLTPHELLTAVDFPAPTTPESHQLAGGLMRLQSARNIVISSICVAIWYRGDRKLLGTALLLLSFSPIVDALVSWKLIGGGLWNHLPVVPILFAFGVGLLR